MCDKFTAIVRQVMPVQRIDIAFRQRRQLPASGCEAELEAGKQSTIRRAAPNATVTPLQPRQSIVTSSESRARDTLNRR